MPRLTPIVVAALSIAAPAFAKVTVAGGSAFTLSAPASPARELSDLAYDPLANLYYAVDDGNNDLYPISLTINNTSGAITAGSIGSPLTLTNAAGNPYPAKRDQEGLSLAAAAGDVWVSYESTPGIARHHLADGKAAQTVDLSAAYPSIRGNRGLESVAANSSTIWVANEEAMSADGPVASGGNGTTVRLTRLTAAGAVTDQFLYQTDGSSPGYTSDRSGVSSLLLLDDNTLLVLERAANTDLFLGTPFRLRIYAVTLAGATNVLGQSITGSQTPVAKTLLWTGLFPSLTTLAINNYEGLTLGPTLDTGERSLILVADNGDGDSFIPTNHNFYSLRIAITLPGDANNDGIVDAADYLAVEQHFGSTGNTNGLLPGDANDDGRVDGNDALFIDRHFGDAWPTNPALVPEPAVATITAATLLLLRPPARRPRP